MKEIKSIDELKEIQLKILKNVDEFCKKNNINYWLDCGTLIGAVRHKGYIPWDDDIDIGMLKKDYEKFMVLYNKSNTRYKFLDNELDSSFNYFIGKVLDTNTILYEPNKKNGIKSAVFIDVFVYNNAPDNEKKLKKMFQKKRKYQLLSWFKNFESINSEDSMIKKIIKKMVHNLLKILPNSYFYEKVILNSKKYDNCKTQKVGNFRGIDNFCCAKDALKSFIYMDFEDAKFPVPIGYDEWLKSNYGDYMQLPPVEKQIPHHEFEAYIINNEGENKNEKI